MGGGRSCARALEWSSVSDLLHQDFSEKLQKPLKDHLVD